MSGRIAVRLRVCRSVETTRFTTAETKLRIAKLIIIEFIFASDVPKTTVYVKTRANESSR